MGQTQSKQRAKSYRGRYRRRRTFPTAGLGRANDRVNDGLCLHGSLLGVLVSNRAQKPANILRPVGADSSRGRTLW